jgi:hypothetical protein
VLGAGFGYNDILSDCVAQKGIGVVDAMRTTGVPVDVARATHPGYVVANEPSANAYSLVALTSAVADGWLTPKKVVGVLDADCPASQRVWKNTTQPYLASVKANVKVHYVIHCPTGASDAGAAAQAIQSAELKMRGSGVDTVVTTDIPLVLFAADAESQQWHPKYLASEGAAALQAYLPEDQLVNVHSAGWEPIYDVALQDQPPVSAAQRSCLEVLKQASITGATATERTMFFSLCGGVNLYLTAIAKAQSLSSSGVLSAIDALSGTFVSPILLGGKTRLAAGHHAAAVQYRSVGYNTACSCFKYFGPVRPMPTYP